MTYNKVDGSHSISGGYMFITEIVVMKVKVEKEQFAHLYEDNEIPRKKGNQGKVWYKSVEL